jgi:hypothetical protein
VDNRTIGNRQLTIGKRSLLQFAAGVFRRSLKQNKSLLMLTDQELNKIFSWLPYRNDWPINLNGKGNDIENFYGSLIYRFAHHGSFNVYESQDGSNSNFIEFICYPRQELYNGNAIAVYISLCAPVACYGQTQFFRNEQYSGHNFLKPDSVGIVSDKQLKPIEEEILDILKDNDLKLITGEFANRPLPKDVIDKMRNVNLNIGDRYLHGLFQCHE